MKNLGRKSIFKITILIILTIGTNSALFPKSKVKDKNKFLILIQKTKDGIKLSGVKGCAFKELSFTLNENEIQAINHFGMNPSQKGEPEKILIPLIFFSQLRKHEKGLI